MAAYASVTTGNSSSLVIDANHPYYLHNSDNLGIPLVTQLLTEHNYYQWSRSISIALSAKMKLGMVNGSLPKPLPTSNQFAMWSRYNDMVLSWLLISMSVEIRDSLSYFATAKEIWDDLAVRFSQYNMPRIFQLRKEIASISQGSLSITAYFTKFRTLFSEIDDLMPLARCSCASSNCACAHAQRLDKYEDMTKLSQFLMGLNELYTAVRGQLLLMQPVTSITQAYSLLLQEKSQREFTKH